MLQSYSLIKLRHNGSNISMHRLVQCVIRERLTHQRRLDIQKEVVNMNNTAFKYSHHYMDLQSRLRFRRFLPQITGPLASCGYDMLDLFAGTSVSVSVSAFLYDEGQISACVDLNQRVVEARERIFGSKDPRTLRAKRFLASPYHQCRPDSFYECLTLYEDVFAVQTDVLGPTHLETLSTKHGLAVAYSDAGSTTKAIALLENTYAARRKQLGGQHPDTLRTKYLLGQIYSKIGQRENALIILEECCMRKGLGRCAVYGEPSICYARTGKTDLAVFLCREALAIQIEVFGSGHRRTAWVKGWVIDVEKFSNNAQANQFNERV